MSIAKTLWAALVNGLATYAGVVIVLFFLDVLLASLDLPILMARIVINPPGEGNALTARDLIAIAAGVAVAIVTLVRKRRPANRQQ